MMRRFFALLILTAFILVACSANATIVGKFHNPSDPHPYWIVIKRNEYSVRWVQLCQFEAAVAGEDFAHIERLKC